MVYTLSDGTKVLARCQIAENKICDAFLAKPASFALTFLAQGASLHPRAVAIAAINGIIYCDVHNFGLRNTEGFPISFREAAILVRAFLKVKARLEAPLIKRMIEEAEFRVFVKDMERFTRVRAAKRRTYNKIARAVQRKKSAAKAELEARRAAGLTRKSALRRSLKKVRKTSTFKPVVQQVFPKVACCNLVFGSLFESETYKSWSAALKLASPASHLPSFVETYNESPALMYEYAIMRLRACTEGVNDLFPSIDFSGDWEHVPGYLMQYRLAVLFDEVYSYMPISSLVADTLFALRCSGDSYLQVYKEAYNTAEEILAQFSGKSLPTQGFGTFICKVKEHFLSAVSAIGDAFFSPLIAMLRNAFDDCLGRYLVHIPGLKAQIENFWQGCVTWAQNMYSKLDLAIRVLSSSAFIAIGLLLISGVVYFVENVLIKSGILAGSGALVGVFIGGILLSFVGISSFGSVHMIKIRAAIVEIASQIYGKEKKPATTPGLTIQGVHDVFGVPLTILETIGSGLLDNTLASMSYVGKFGAAMENIRKGVMCARQFFGWLIEQVGTCFDSVTGRKSAFFTELSSLVQVDVAKWIEDAQQFILEAEILPEGDRIVIDTVHILLEKGHKIQQLLCSTKQTTTFNYSRLVHTIVTELNKVYSRFTRCGRSVQYRCEPFWLYIWGGSHCGKTIFMNHFKNELVNYLGTSNENIYYKNARDSYWSKYRQQRIVCIDDLSSVETDPSLESEFIQLVATAPYALNMAAVEDKGTEFNSEVIITTANCYTARTNARIQDMDAYNNRRDVVVEFRRKPDTLFDASKPLDAIEARLLHNAQQVPTTADGWIDAHTLTAELLGLMMAKKEQQAMLYNHWKHNVVSSCDVFDILTSKIKDELFWISVSKFGLDTDQAPNTSRLIAVDGVALAVDPSDFTSTVLMNVDAQDLENRCMEMYPNFSDALARWDINGITRQFMQQMLEGPSTVVSIHALSDTASASHREYFATLLLSQRVLLRMIQKRITNVRSSPAMEQIERGKSKIGSWFKEGHDMVVANGGRIFLIFAAIILVLYFGSIAFGLIKSVFFGSSSVAVAAAAQLSVHSVSAAYGSDNVSYASKNMRRVYRPSRFNLQGSQGPQSQATAEEIILNNLVRIDLPDGNVISAARFVGRSLMLTDHQARTIADGTLVRFIYCDNRGQMKMPISHVWQGENLIRFSDTEVCVYRSPILSSLPAAPDSIFVKDPEKLPRLMRIKGMVVKLGRDSALTQTDFQAQESVLHEWQGDVMLNTAVTVIDAYEYGGDYRRELPRSLIGTYMCEKNDCGGLLVAEVEGSLKIVGMHTAGKQNANGSYQACAALLPLPSCMMTTQGGPSTVNLEGGLDTEGVTKLGWLSPQDVPHCPTKTVFRRVGEDYLFPAPVKSKEPAILHGSDERLVGTSNFGYDPLKDAVKKYESPMLELEQQILEDVATEILEEWFDCQTAPLVNLTEEEAINGNDDVAFLDPIVKSSSEGYPYVLSRKSGEKGKERFLMQDATLPEGKLKLVPGTPVHRDYEQLCKTIYTEVPELWVVEIPKDETLPERKILTPKTRTFSLLPFPHTLAQRKYTGSLCAFLQSNRHRLAMAVGVNPYSDEWTQIYNRLASMSPNAMNGDYASFDGLLNFQMYDVIIRMINRMYRDDHTTARYNLLIAMCGRFSICGTQVYQVRGGLPSGCAITVVMNSIFNEILIRYVYRKTINVIERPFKRHVKLIIYGDDNLIAVDPSIYSGTLLGYNEDGTPRIIEQFNGEIIKRELANVGVTITDGSDKTALLFEEKPLSQLDFLKRGFNRQADGRVLAPLDKTAIYTPLVYVREQAGQWMDPLFQNVQVALRELYLHKNGEQEFTAVRNFFLHKGLMWNQLPTWVEVRNFHQKQYSGWMPFLPHKYLGVVIPTTNITFMQDQARNDDLCVIADQTLLAGPNWRKGDMDCMVISMTQVYPSETNTFLYPVVYGYGSGQLPTQTWVRSCASSKTSWVKKAHEWRNNGKPLIFRCDAPYLAGWAAAISFLTSRGANALDLLTAYPLSGGKHVETLNSYFERRAFIALPSDKRWSKSTAERLP